MRYRWPENTRFTQVVLSVEQEVCSQCQRHLHVCDHRFHPILSLQGPLELLCKLAHCPDPCCAAHRHTLSPLAEAQITLPYWLIGWDVFSWLGFRRFTRHWSIPQLQAELRDSYRIRLSDDAISGYLQRYRCMVAARHQDAALLAEHYKDIASVVLTIDGLQPEKGHETLYVVRELRGKRVWFAEALLSSSAAEVQRSSRDAAPIVAFFSAKGGSGATTLATNTAAALARKFPRQVLLIDVSAPFGHAALFADLIATGSIASASKVAAVDFETVLRGNIFNHKSGMGVLPGTLRPEEVDLMTGDLTGRVLDVVVSWQKLILVDLGTSLGEAALSVLERSECVVIVIPPEIAAMTDARRSLAVFRDILNVADSRIELVLNQRVPHPPLDRAGVEAILGRKMSVTIGFDGSRPEDAALAGGLVLVRDPNSLVARGATDLARVFVANLKMNG